jgi:hypothetical protein
LGRQQFVQRYFHHDITDPSLYDLVINLEHMPRSDAIDLIASEAKRHEQRVLADALGRASATRHIRQPNESPR